MCPSTTTYPQTPHETTSKYIFCNNRKNRKDESDEDDEEDFNKNVCPQTKKSSFNEFAMALFSKALVKYVFGTTCILYVLNQKHLLPKPISSILYKNYNIRSIINLCEEYRGPVHKYKKLSMNQIRFPTVDHFEPSFEDLVEAVKFIQENKAQNKRVYIHCRAGHGRSAAVTMAWLIYKNPFQDLKVLNENMLKIRNVRKYLWKQPNIQNFQNWARYEKRE